MSADPKPEEFIPVVEVDGLVFWVAFAVRLAVTP